MADSKGVTRGANDAKKSLRDVEKQSKATGRKLDRTSKKSDDHAKTQREEIQRTGEETEKAGLRGKNAFDALKRSAVGAFAFLSGTAGMRAWMKDMSRTTVGIDNMARSLGDVPQHLEAVRYALRSEGVPEQAANGLYGSLLSKAFDKQQKAKANAIAEQYGTVAIDENGAPNTHILEDLYRNKKFMRDIPEAGRFDTIAQLGGDPQLINFFRDKNALGKIEDYKKFAPTEDDITKGRQLLESWTHLEAQTQKVFLNVFNQTAPALNSLAVAIDKLVASHPEKAAESLKDLSALFIGWSVYRAAGGGPLGAVLGTASAAGIYDVRHGDPIGNTYRDMRARYLDDGLIGAQIMSESQGNPNKVSSKGAEGILQFMPRTAASLGINPFDPVQSIEDAERLKARLLKKYHGSTTQYLAAYNWGEGNLDRDLNEHPIRWYHYLPKETHDYIDRTISNQRSGRIYNAQRLIAEKQAAIHNQSSTTNNNGAQTTVNGNIEIHKGDENRADARGQVASAVQAIYPHINTQVV